jgi:apolipoprotein N-acyltransferase
MRGTNNGVTALVDHQGKIYQQLEQYSAGELSGTVVPRVGQTFFNRFGSWPTVGSVTADLSRSCSPQITDQNREDVI